MDISIFWAKYLGFYMLIMAAVFLFRRNIAFNIINDITHSVGLSASVGFLLLAIGLIILISHPIVELSWRGFITLLGAMDVIHGINRIAFPLRMKKMSILLMIKYWWLYVAGCLISGSYLLYRGFFPT